jgi:hypothetical protein
MANTPIIKDIDLFASKNQAFTFPLSTLVAGINAKGQEFTEDTVLSFISHRGSSFYLKNSLDVGARLKLIIDLPEKLAEDKKLKLVLKGKVVMVDPLRERPAGQKVAVEFDAKYLIRPEAS